MANTLAVANTDPILLVAADISTPIADADGDWGLQTCDLDADSSPTTMGAGSVPGVTYCSCYVPPNECEECSSSSFIHVIGFSLLAILASLWN